MARQECHRRYYLEHKQKLQKYYRKWWLNVKFLCKKCHVSADKLVAVCPKG